jgi:glycosyltransferase involved in cell wall biosynthesis
MSALPSFAVITPARDELENLKRLSGALFTQSVLPTAWVVVDTGSTDGTPNLVEDMAAQAHWVHLFRVHPDREAARGAPVVRALHAAIAQLGALPEVIVKVDADISMKPDFFERLLTVMSAEPHLGIWGGICLERSNDGWAEPNVREWHIRGAVRAYRRACLEQILPFEERVGWDGIDLLKARTRGWQTHVVKDAFYYHHRPLGARDLHPWRSQFERGEASHFMGYRPSYLALRAVYRAASDRRAIAMMAGFGWSSVTRAPRCSDLKLRETLRREQRLTVLAREVLVRRGRHDSPDQPVQFEGELR